MGKNNVFPHRVAGVCETSPWWLRDHLVTASRLPGLHRAVFNLVRGDGADGYDGVSELWYDSETTLGDSVAQETSRLEA